ncbi:MAG: hypothetical protein JO360_00880 [Acidobacteria bacterium]|nr:hypothetical protein [Acidobacteriota bacterium]
MSHFRFARPRFSLQLLLLITLAFGCTARREVELHPEIKASPRVGVTVTNRDDFAYPRVTVFVKGHYWAEAGDIAPGQTVTIPFDRFATDEGEHFDVATMKPEAIRIRTWLDGKAASKIFEVK